MRIIPLTALASILLLAATATAAEPAAPEPTPLATARTAKLNADVKTLRVQFYFNNKPGNADKPYYNLLLSVPNLPAKPDPDAAHLSAQITEKQAQKIVDYLTTEGFLDLALDGNRNHGPVPPKEPYYTLMVWVENNGDPILYEQWIRFDLQMLYRFDGFRKILDADPAKKMDTLLDRMADQRKEWEKDAAPATGPAKQNP